MAPSVDRALARRKPPRAWLVLCLAGMAVGLAAAHGCRRHDPGPPAQRPTAPRTSARATTPAPSTATAAAPLASAPRDATDSASPPEANGSSAPPDPPRVAPAAARKLLSGDGIDLDGCPPDDVRCWLEHAYADDPAAQKLVLQLFDDNGSVVGREPGRVMDGGWRGKITLVPERPVGRHRRHLQWLAASLADFAWLFDELEQQSGETIDYRFAPLELAFFRSVGRTTPSAYASGWRVAYNVNGSLHAGEAAVRETMFHEVFHLNDTAKGDWSDTALPPIVDPIIAKCTRNGRRSTPCLRPYAPGTTMVRGGTYYAFQPGNGVWEYAAELALRYYREHRQWLKAGRLSRKPFKCGPPENAKAWRAMVTTFFSGVDLIPPCTQRGK